MYFDNMGFKVSRIQGGEREKSLEVVMKNKNNFYFNFGFSV